MKVRSVVDSVKHNITAQVTHFTVFAILVDTALKSPAALSVSQLFIGIMIGGLTLLAFILYLRAQRRKSDTDRYWDRGELIPARSMEQSEQWYWNGKKWVPPSEKELREEWYWSGNEWVPPRNKELRDEWYSDWTRWIELRRIETTEKWYWDGSCWVQPGESSKRPSRSLQFSGKN